MQHSLELIQRNPRGKSATQGKRHLNWNCASLRRTMISWSARDQVTRTHSDYTIEELEITQACDDAERLCRKCALANVLAVYAELPDQPAKNVALTFSGQHPNPASSEHHIVSETGAARLRVLAARMDLQVLEATVGPVAFGNVSAPVARVVGQVFNAFVHPVVAELSADEIAAWWMLWVGHPDMAFAELSPIAQRLCA